MTSTHWRGFLLAVTAAMLWLAAPSLAWNSRGHMLVAAIAYRQLTPTAREHADHLLKRNPFYNRWLAQAIDEGIESKNRHAAVFAIAATWPDQIKQAVGYVNDGDRPEGPTARQNIGYADKLQHRYWHFLDQPFSTDGSPLPPIPTPNAEDRITLFRMTIADGASDGVKSYDLVWLLHLVGDLHQPLHAASRFSAAFPKGDNGANLVPLCPKPCRNELHAFWDDLMGNDPSVSAVLTQAASLPAAPANLAADLDVTHWAADGLSLAKSAVYVSPIGTGSGPFALTPQYEQHAQAVAARQVALAGARLANILNSSLK